MLAQYKIILKQHTQILIQHMMFITQHIIIIKLNTMIIKQHKQAGTMLCQAQLSLSLLLTSQWLAIYSLAMG